MAHSTVTQGIQKVSQEIHIRYHWVSRGDPSAGQNKICQKEIYYGKGVNE